MPAPRRYHPEPPHQGRREEVGLGVWGPSGEPGLLPHQQAQESATGPHWLFRNQRPSSSRQETAAQLRAVGLCVLIPPLQCQGCVGSEGAWGGNPGPAWLPSGFWVAFQPGSFCELLFPCVTLVTSGWARMPVKGQSGPHGPSRAEFVKHVLERARQQIF